MSIQLTDALDSALTVGGALTPTAAQTPIPALSTLDSELTAKLNAQAQASANRWAHLASTAGAGAVGYVQSGTTTAVTVEQALQNFVFATLFPTLQDAIDYAAANGRALLLRGTYTYATAPNFARQNLVMFALGTVTFEHTGSGRAFLMDAGAGSVYNVQMYGDFAVKGNANTDTSGGVFIRAIQHSRLKLRAYDMPGKAFLVNFAVLTDMDFTCSVNQQAFSITPTQGIVLDKRNAGEYVADCRLNLVMEGVSGLGVDFADVQGCLVTGTSEGNGSGFRDSATCSDNTFVGFWCEVNTVRDYELYGLRNRFVNGKSISAVAGANCEVVTAVGTVFSGGFWRHVNLQSTSSGTLFDSVALSDNVSLGITGPGAYKSINSYKVDVNGIKTAVVPDRMGESGVWTPSVVGSSGSSAHTYGVREGAFSVLGGVCTFQARLTIDVKDTGMGGTVSISGLPRPANSSAYASGTVGVTGGITADGARPQIGWYAPPGSSSLVLANVGAGLADTLVSASQIANGTRIFVSGSYLV